MTTPPPADTDPRHEFLLVYLRTHEAACPACGYNLFQLTSPRCPECGLELRLTVGASEPYLRAWMTLAVPTFVTAGLGLLFLLLIPKIGWPPTRNPGWLATTLYNSGVAYSMFCVAIAAAALAARRRFLRLSRQTQWLIAGAGGGLAIAAFLAVVLQIR